jgi:uncharacterized repeat protein (TIGR03803 family)
MGFSVYCLDPMGGPMKPGCFVVTLATLSALLLITAPAAPAQTETVLYNFCSQPNCGDGAYPESNLTWDDAGNLYGTTYEGGLYGHGTVFELSPLGGGGWNETVLYSFTGGTDGAYPSSNVIFDGVGNLYATTEWGGADGYGVVFELSPLAGNWTETVLYSFGGAPDGDHPVAGLIMDTAGNLYGTTYFGGAYGNGSAFELSPSGGGSWTEKVIYSASHNVHGYIAAGLTMDAAGNIFGGTMDTAFELSPNGNDGWSPNVIHIFPAKVDLRGTPALGKTGDVYGTTEGGGSKSGDTGGRGMVYRLSLGKTGWKATELYSFKGEADGASPYGGIVFDAAGDIYGTTAGTVFELVAPVGKGSYQQKTLWQFDGTDGASPLDSPILDSAGNLYGTTFCGGPAYEGGYCGDGGGYGVVFEVTP